MRSCCSSFSSTLVLLVSGELEEACQLTVVKIVAANVNMPKDKVTALHQGYAFVEFDSAEDADYAIK